MPELPAEQQPQREGTPQDSCQPAAQRLFTGPRSIEATAAKYMISYKEAEETDHSIKRTRMVQSSSQVCVAYPGSPCHLLPMPITILYVTRFSNTSSNSSTNATDTNLIVPESLRSGARRTEETPLSVCLCQR